MPKYKLEELRRIQAETCKTFGNPKRLLILEAIWDQNLLYKELLERTGLDKVTLTQQTTLMRRKGIIRSERTEKGLVFSVSNPKILKAFGLMREVVIDRIKEDNELLSAVIEQKS
jgi:DNA-binding transcriptional ArsR family regulator